MTKLAKDFSKDKGKRTGLASYCKPCVKKYNQTVKRDNWAKHTPEERAARTRKWKIKRTYGITVAEYWSMFDAQDGKCAICGSADTGRKDCPMPIDHDHRTGINRELLCHQCNTGLGMFGDDPDRLVAAAAYLIKHGAAVTSI
jgi:hypothetical protein